MPTNRAKKYVYGKKWRSKLEGIEKPLLINIIRECYKRLDHLEETLQSVNDKLKADTDSFGKE